MQKRRGFTLVELVIVIAVIAVLAGILIGTFAAVIKRANDSAQIQKTKSEEIAQKAEDILKKIDDSNWYGWEDFENDIVAKITKAYGEKEGATLSKDELKKAVKEAVEEYAKNNADNKTELTEEQVKAIIENALGTVKYEGVTEAQVRAIVNAATNSLQGTQLTVAQVRSIVNAANANNLTQAQVAAIIAQAGLATAEDLNTAVQDLADEIGGLSDNLPTVDDIKATIIDLVPVTITANETVEGETFAELVTRVNSGSTIIIGADYKADTTKVLNLTLGDTDSKLLYIKSLDGDDKFIGTLNITAAAADIYLLGDFSGATVNAIKVASSSLHIKGHVGTLVINKGHAVVEDSGVVDTLTAAPSKEATVDILIKEQGTVGALNAEYQKNGNTTNDWIKVENNGTVGTATLSVVADNGANTKVTTNVVLTNGQNATGTEVDKIVVDDVPVDQVNLSVKEEGQTDQQASKVYYVNNETQLTEALAATGDSVIINIGDDFEITNVALFTKSTTIYGCEHEIQGKANRIFRVTVPNIDIKIFDLTMTSICTATKDVRGISFDDASSGSSLLLDGCVISASFYVINAIPGADNLTITIKNGTVAAGWAAINMYSNNSIVNVENSTLRGLNDKGESSWNNFNTITLDGNCLGQGKSNVGTAGSNNTINISKSTVYASSNSGNTQYWVGIQYGAINNTVIVDSESRIINASEEDMSSVYNIGFYCNYSSGNWDFYANNSTIKIGNKTVVLVTEFDGDNLVSADYIVK